MPLSSTAFSSLPALLGLVVSGCLIGASGHAQESSEALKEVPFDQIEDKFFQVQDSSGYFWQSAENGSLTSGQTQYLQAGLNLLIDGKAFAPTQGSMVPPSVESVEAKAVSLTLQETREGLKLSRSLAFDMERGGVRLLDTVTNTAKESVSIQISLRTTYPFAWQSLHNQKGNPLSSDPVLRLGEQDQGVLVHFSPIEGRHDTFILVGSGEGRLQPTLKASSNRRELTLGYEVVVDPGESVSLLHWILQAGLQQVEDAQVLVKSLVQNGELIAPRVERSLIPSVVNFSKETFPEAVNALGSLRQLISLNRALEGLGAQRRSKSVLWTDSNTQLTGEVSGSSSISINDGLRGSQNIPVENIAAILDRESNSGEMQIFLRDGLVMVGAVEDLGLSFKGEATESARPLSPGSFSALLFPVSERDGVSLPEVSGVIELVDGSVLAVKKDDQLLFQLSTGFGDKTLPVEELSELKFLGTPVPHFRCATKSGDRFPAFLGGATLKVDSAGDAPIEVPIAYVSRFGTNGLREETIREGADAWIDFDEIPTTWLPGQGFLLTGGELREGSFADETLEWKQGDEVRGIATEQIKRLRRETSQSSILFSITLKSGEQLRGLPASPLVNVTLGGKTWPLPIEKLYAFRSQ